MPLPSQTAAGARLVRAKILLALFIICLFGLAQDVWAKPTTEPQVRRAVAHWLSLEDRPLGARLGRAVQNVVAYPDEIGEPLYYIVYLNPQGFAIVPADDLVEPVVGFTAQGVFDPSPDNPLGALVSRDLPGRVLTMRQLEKEAVATGRPGRHAGLMDQARRKWRWLESEGETESPLEAGVGAISDVRVAPLVQSKWSQGNEGSAYCYNYYTPNHYVCGCVATALAQLLRFWQWPTAGVGTGSYTIYVDDTATTRNLRGGNGAGGPYDWGNMVLDPSSSTTDSQRQAIGALTHDAGLPVHMSYAAGGSGADTLATADALKNPFGYSNAKKGYNSGSNLPTAQRNTMVNPNLDAGYPILFGITGSVGGHAIVCDGYGYNSSTLYHHLNLGWAGASDAWYNLPNIDSSPAFTSVYKCVYNVYVSGAGEIISGRVTTSGGAPISGVTVTAARSGGGSYATSTNAQGIYTFPKIPSGSTYTLTASRHWYSFSSQTVTTGTSSDNSTTVGNVWGANFVGSSVSLSLNDALDNHSLTFSTGGSAAWFPQTATYTYDYAAAQSGAISHGQTSWLQTTAPGPGKLWFSWKVSSEANKDFLKVYVDGNLVEQISGEVNWTARSVKLAAGSHTVRWEYVRDASGEGGANCAWLDKVSVTPAYAPISPIFPLLLD
jgi:hypothetical protein